MKNDFAQAMRLATLAALANDVAKATTLIHDAVSGRVGIAEYGSGYPSRPVQAPGTLPSHGSFDRDLRPSESGSAGRPSPTAPGNRRPATNSDAAENSPRARGTLGEVLRALRGGPFAPPAFTPPRARKPSRPPSVPDGAQFLTRSFTCAAGTREYKLYIPGSAADAPRGLVVMLHGCKQDPDDFAVGTNMNAIAESRGLIVAYPGQARTANPSSCWNWFDPGHQARDAGEPSIVAGITRELATKFGLDRRRTFVAGLSAGGAMAAVMAETYPDLYAGVGVHSGLAYRSASDTVSAFAAMRGPGRISALAEPLAAAAMGRSVRVIVFHGNADRTVHPANGDGILEAACERLVPGHDRLELEGVAGDRRYRRTIFERPNDVPSIELWSIDGAGHAWSGGNASGTFTDSAGPDASAEMVRFFVEPRAELRERRDPR